MTPSCAILILNYNGEHLLRQFLGSVVTAAKASRASRSFVIVVDNQSTDNSREWIEENFTSVNVKQAPSNRFLYSLNWAAQRLESELVLLLNNDMHMTPDCLDPLIDVLLSNPQVFSVTPQILKTDRITPNAGRFLGDFHRGLLQLSLANTVQAVSPTLFGCGGAQLVRRQDFLRLGGFDELYFPAYWEDVDLSYKAWKQGRPSLYQPQSVMYHVHSASMDNEPSMRERKAVLNYRNCWLLTWRNVSDRQVLMANIYWTGRYYASTRRRNNYQYVTAHHEAFRLWRAAVRKRIQDDRGRVISDHAILEIIRNAASQQTVSATQKSA